MKKNLLLIALKWGGLLGAALAACELVKMAARDINYDAGAVFSILLLIVIIVFLYAGIKEYRDDLCEGYIRFPKAFGAGAVTVLVAFVVAFAYMLIHYQYIDKNGLARLNTQNEEVFYARLAKDTVTQSDASKYLSKTDSVMRATYTAMLQNDMLEDGCADFTHEQMERMLTAYNDRVMLRPKIDTSFNTYGQFSAYAQRVFLDVYQNLLANAQAGDSCYQSLALLVNNSKNGMEQVDVMEEAYRQHKDSIPHYTSILPVALSYAVSVLLYGLFLAIFVALYLTRKKEENTEQETVES